MNKKEILKIFADTAYVRTGGSPEELRCAQYIASCVPGATLEEFSVDMATMEEAVFAADGKQIPCKGYLCAGSSTVEAPFYYLRSADPGSLAQCRGKIVLVDGYLGYWIYRDLLENGAVGFVTYDGNCNYADRDVDQRELRSYVSKGEKIPGVNINAKDAVALIRQNPQTASITLRQQEYTGTSHNVVLDLPGTRPEYIVLTAHYDSTSLSQGAYDNMSGSVGLMAMAEHFRKAPHSYGLRFIWCGSEERGLLGAKAYVAAHAEELKDVALNVNLDMIGCVMGKFLACCTAEEASVSYIRYLGSELGMGLKAYQDVYSSDSTPFADQGIPAISFARIAPPATASIHNRYDTQKLISAPQMQEDIGFITAFVSRMANAAHCPVAREMPGNMKDKLDIYLCRKRDPKQ